MSDPIAHTQATENAQVRVGFRYQDGEVLSPERESLSEDVELPVAVIDRGDGEWLTLGELRDLHGERVESSPAWRYANRSEYGERLAPCGRPYAEPPDEEIAPGDYHYFNGLTCCSCGRWVKPGEHSSPPAPSAEISAPCRRACGLRHLDIQACAQEEQDCRIAESEITTSPATTDGGAAE